MMRCLMIIAGVVLAIWAFQVIGAAPVSAASESPGSIIAMSDSQDAEEADTEEGAVEDEESSADTSDEIPPDDELPSEGEEDSETAEDSGDQG